MHGKIFIVISLVSRALSQPIIQWHRIVSLYRFEHFLDVNRTTTTTKRRRLYTNIFMNLPAGILIEDGWHMFAYSRRYIYIYQSHLTRTSTAHIKAILCNVHTAYCIHAVPITYNMIHSVCVNILRAVAAAFFFSPHIRRVYMPSLCAYAIHYTLHFTFDFISSFSSFLLLLIFVVHFFFSRNQIFRVCN